MGFFFSFFFFCQRRGKMCRRSESFLASLVKYFRLYLQKNCGGADVSVCKIWADHVVIYIYIYIIFIFYNNYFYIYSILNQQKYGKSRSEWIWVHPHILQHSKCLVDSLSGGIHDQNNKIWNTPKALRNNRSERADNILIYAHTPKEAISHMITKETFSSFV